jgi:hypothetical protein
MIWREEAFFAKQEIFLGGRGERLYMLNESAH